MWSSIALEPVGDGKPLKRKKGDKEKHKAERQGERKKKKRNPPQWTGDPPAVASEKGKQKTAGEANQEKKKIIIM